MSRKISLQEIELLESQFCSSTDWGLIEVHDSFDGRNIHQVHFEGKCTIGEGVTLRNIGYLSNYRIGNFVSISNVGRLEVTGPTSFGNGIEVDVLNEGGGREVPIFNELTAQIAYLIAVFRHDPDFVSALKKMIDDRVKEVFTDTGWVGDGSTISDCQVIRNVWIDKFVKIDGATSLEEGSIIGEDGAPSKIGNGVIAKGFILQSGSIIDSGALVEHSFIGQGVRIGKQFSMENCLFFANCEGFHSEAVSVFAGPYTVTHHRSTLLIAGMYSFYNAGSGTNQSNHMYKLGPVHQGIVERGSKTGSFSYLLWPSKVGAFSVVMGKHGGNFDTTEFPFSYITVDGDRS
jgi:NDP-sugar pyrophosphorylase family protein